MPDRKCTCRRKRCERHGDCAACRAYHAKTKRPPDCEVRGTGPAAGAREAGQGSDAREGRPKPCGADAGEII